MSGVHSAGFFRKNWLCWQLAGIEVGQFQYNRLYLFYGIIVNVLVTFGYPFHLGMSLFRNETQGDNFKNLSVFWTCLACSLKILIYRMKLDVVRECETILGELDRRVRNADELHFFKQLGRNIRNITLAFLGLYTIIGVLGELSFIFKTEPGMLYPAWFPFDWRNSKRNYYIANIYQIVGISYQLLQNYADDCYPPMALCLLSGHIRLLSLRVSKIGYDCDDKLENLQELQRCIADQKNLYRLFDAVQQIISLPMFMQFAVTTINICVAMVALIFYADAPFDRLYYLAYFLAMPLEIFPTCYYGSDAQMLLEKLHYAAFSCNWIHQSKEFKKHMILFTERTLKTSTAMAGGMLRIHLDTFFSTCRGAYSLFTVIMRMKN